MIAPEIESRSNGQTSRASLLRRCLAASALIFCVLELWRPCFFLTDDNLDGAFPFFVEIGRNLLAGHSPFYSVYLFGSHYNYLRDACSFSWHPVYLLISLLAGTPFNFAIIDLDEFFLFMVATTGFVFLAHYLRREMELKITDGWLVFYTLSFTYSMIALTTGASWYNFTCNYSALPWLALGIIHHDWRKGLFLVVVFSMHEILGGHLAPTISNSLFLSLFALLLAWRRGSSRPLSVWFGGTLLALVLLSPLLIPVTEGFLASARNGGVGTEEMEANNIPGTLFPTSVFLGMALWIIHPPEHAYETYTLATGASAAAWCLIPALASLRRWRDIDLVTLGMMIVAAVFIWRPHVLSLILTHLPLLRSMRWPFREFIQFQFFLHLFLVVRPPGFTPLTRWRIALLSTGLMVLPLFLYRIAPSFNTMEWDRRLILSGKVYTYWTHVHAYLKPDDRVAVIIPLNLYTDDRFEEPYSLLGAYDYAVLGRFVNVSGYSPTTMPRDQAYTNTLNYYPFGAYIPAQREGLLQQYPNLKFITLESLKPLRITLSSRDGPTIDLTPFVPIELSPKPFPPVASHAAFW